MSLTIHLLSIYEEIKLLEHFQRSVTTNALKVVFKNIYYGNWKWYFEQTNQKEKKVRKLWGFGFICGILPFQEKY